MTHSLDLHISVIVAGILLGLLFYKLIGRNSKNNKLFFKTLLILAAIVFLVNLVANCIIIKQITIGESSFFSIILQAILLSLEPFAFQTHFYDGSFNDFFFGSSPSEPGHPWWVFLLSLTFILSSIISVSLLIKAFNRKRAGREWLSRHKQRASHTHLFFGEGSIPLVTANSIKAKRPDDACILVNYPAPEEGALGLSVWEKIRRLFEERDQDTPGPFDTIVYSRIPLGQTSGSDICKMMNLKDLEAYLNNPGCKVYLLSDRDEDNLRCADILYKSQCKAEIYCRTCREGVGRMYERSMSNTPGINIHLADTSILSVQTIKNHPELLPVQFVRKGTDSQGRKEGWVDSGFRSMIIGFGETGQEALGFLYEYGAFSDKDFGKSPFSCLVIDERMDLLEKSYRQSSPGMNEEAGIYFKKCTVWANDFWDLICESMPTMNYIVICLGDDRTNLQIAIDLADFALRSGKDLSKDFCILVNLNDPTHLDEITIQHYNSIRPFHHCIHTFGAMEEVWSFGQISGEDLKTDAKRFFKGYLMATGDNPESAEEKWDKRDREIVSTSDFTIYAKRIRQRAQDYANCLHALTKLALVDPDILNARKEIAACIPADYKTAGKHYTGTDSHIEKTLHYLAVHEHLRWEASHLAMGYLPGDQTDEIRKTHAYLKSFDSLPPEVRHYDYLVIKTTFELY